MALIEQQITQEGSANLPYDWRAEPTGLYLHVPFCESKCIYCDFNSYAHMEDKFGPFVDAICADIGRGVSWDLPGTPGCEGAPVATVFFGGGTPSVLLPEQIARILGAARARYNIAPGAEITMEANPGTITLDKFEGYLEAGVNRLSMGVQVLDDRMLKKLGRIHTAEGALESYSLARQAGFTNVNLDFIYGLPGQDLAHLDRMLDRLLDVDPLPEHLSCYSLIVEEHTPLYIGVERGLIQVPGEDEVAGMYELIGERLAASGYEQYEISNWAFRGSGVGGRGYPLAGVGIGPPADPTPDPRSPIPACAHNLVYWHDQRYLAFGPGASGYWDRMRFSTVLGPADYISLVAEGRSVLQERYEVTEREEIGEFMMLGLRLNSGVSRQEFARRFGTTLDDLFGTEIRDLQALGLLESAGDTLRLSERGRLLGNEVFARFIH